jgi:hypothetical protein
MSSSAYAVGPIEAKGAFTADFGLPGVLPLDQLPGVIERDRMHMARRPGMRSKHLPFRMDSTTGNYLSGGRYLFDTLENAESYRSWAANEFVLDGFKFLERPFFLNPVCHVWRVVGGHDWAPIREGHAVIRFERWLLSQGDAGLENAWLRIRDKAQERGLSSALLLHNAEEQLAGVISIARRTSNDSNLDALESMPELGAAIDQPGSTKVFDRTSWVLSIWFPIGEGEPVTPALWPNSPPLPSPAPAANG